MIEAPFSKRIYNDFCLYCRHAGSSSELGCPFFVSKEAVCVRFEFATAKLKKQYQEETLDNWATTIWMNRGKSLEAIWAMSKRELRSVLTNQHYDYFVEREKEDRLLLEQALREQEERASDAEKALAKVRQTAAKHKEVQPNVKIKFTDDASSAELKSLKSLTSVEHVPDEVRGRLKNLLDSSVTVLSASVSPFPKILPHSEDVRAQNHYFYCQKPDGSEATYKRSIKNKAEIASFRKYLIKNNIAILNEEEK